MSFIRQSTDQAREAFTAMPMQSRVISGMLVAVIAIGLGFLVRGGESSRMDPLFGGRSLGEQEINAVELAFGSAGLNDWKREGRRITIPQESRGEYLAALEGSAALPMSLRTSVQDAIDKINVFDPNGLRVARLMHAKELDLGIKIAHFSDVKWASVEYDRGERVGLSRSRPQSASVVVNPEGTDALANHRIRQIQDLVRSSYAGMTGEDVVVIDTNATSSSAAFGDDDPLMRKTREAEAHFEQKIRHLLVGYPARIAVTAEIDPTMDAQKTTLSFDPEPTNLSSTSRKSESSTSRPANSGVPGVTSNGITNNRAMRLADNQETTKTKEDERESSGVVGQQYENSRVASLQIKNLRVSVGLPESYYKTVLTENYLALDPKNSIADSELDLSENKLEELRAKTKENIQSTISVLLPGGSAGKDLDESIIVSHYPDLPFTSPPEPETAKLALTWLAESWQTIALVMLAILALMVARSAARSGTTDAAASEFSEGFGLELPAPPAQDDDSPEPSDQMTITGGSLKDELSALVEKNPEVAANVIRGWVGEAA